MPDSLTRIRESLWRSRSGDPSARRELEEGLRGLSSGEYGEVLARWQEARSRGDNLSPEELCQGGPESTPTVVEVIRLVEDAHACLTATGTMPEPDRAAARLPNVPGYELLNVLGRGGMGVVYKARQLGFNRVVALKMIRADDDGPADYARFRIEAEAVARLRHANIVQVYDTGEADGSPYFSMEHLDGGSLAERARGEPLSCRQAAEVVEVLARAVQHAHERGVIHRDLKPSNVLFGADGTPKVTDFGLARLLDAAATRTASAVVLGTACYMAPEQAEGRSRDIGPATDVYGLGAILYSVLTGRPPVERGSWAVVLERVRTQEPAEPRRLRPDVERDLEAVCLKCLEKKPARRYASARALADDLRRYLDGRPTQARPLGRLGRLRRFCRRRPFLSAAVLLLLLLVAAAPAVRHYRDPDRIPKEYLAELERQRTVTLLGPTGPPAWRREVIGQAEVLHRPDDEGAFTVASINTACVELLPATPAGGYRFRAEVRHLEGQPTGLLGIYFARSQFLTSRGTEHCLAAFTFNDRRKVKQRRADGTGQNLARLQLWRRPLDGAPAQFPTEVAKPFRPAVDEGLVARPWRTLEIVHTRERLKVYWDTELVGEMACEQMASLFQTFVNRPLDPTVHEPALTPSFRPGGGLGLYFDNGRVSIRNVSVGPPDEPKPHD